MSRNAEDLIQTIHTDEGEYYQLPKKDYFNSWETVATTVKSSRFKKKKIKIKNKNKKLLKSFLVSF